MPKNYCFPFWISSLVFSTVGLPIILTTSVSAQITPDNSLGHESSIVTPNIIVQDEIADLIEGGAIRGHNLFHSFEQFNVSNDAAVYFANPDGIANILTRITGNNVSEIFGTLGVLQDSASHIEGTANLFLLNPHGIVFGEDASLDVNGSFLATTANSYIFENGFEYSASHPETPPLLTINIPLGLQFDSNSGEIEVRGTGNNLILNPGTLEFFLRDLLRPKGLEVQTGNTLGLVGGEINLTGGNLTALQGRVELGSINEAANVYLNPTEEGFTLDYKNITNFADINLTDSASIDVSGNGGGNIQLKGKNISLLNNSVVISNTLGSENGGTVQISAIDTLKFIGDETSIISDEDSIFVPSGVFNQVNSTATGNGSNLDVEASKIQISQNALITSSVSGVGDGGAINIKVKELILNSGGSSNTLSQFSFPTGIISLVNPIDSATGKSSNITIEAEKIEMINAALIGTATFNAGDSGDISIQTNELEIGGTGFLPSLTGDGAPFPSGIFTTVAAPSATGNGGNITISSNSLEIADGGQIRSGTLGLGDSGDISIQAEEILIKDTLLQEGNVASGIFSSSGQGILSGDFQQTTGNGGNIRVATKNLRLTGGGQIGTGTSSTGNSGDLVVNAQDIEIIGQSSNNPNASLTGFADTSGLFTSVGRFDALGDGGDILVNTDNLQILNGGAIAANVFGIGSGGDIQIDAHNVSVSDSFVVSDIRSGITTTVESTGTGDAGNIEISANNLNLTSGGSIAASAIGNGDAGDIDLETISLNLQGVASETSFKSQIAAFSQSDSDAGNIYVASQNVLLGDRATISVSNLGNGDSGNLNLNSQNLSLENGASLEAKVNAGSQGNINLTTDNIFVRDKSQITSEATGAATGGNIFIENQDNLVLLENSQIIANAVQGNGGNIEITTRGFFVSSDSLITASSQFGLDGTVKIDIIDGSNRQAIADRNYDFISIDQLISNRCFGSQVPQQSSFTYVGRGGTPINPETRIDQDYQDHNLAKLEDLSSEIVEANAVFYDDQGSPELVNLSRLPNRINYLDWESTNICKSTDY